ncbi:MAG: carboxypeptidase regulatory-like domain-containing protein, partial [Candidatus Krumholzibacteriota bacterium]|nr:carboxypeptidase regulatory-like domain-containing protein [Candidatus Krumholzibacteriota bacterium]
MQGRVYDEADKTPIPGVLVVGKMAGGGWSFERATTDEAGRFELRYLALDVLSLTFHPREHRQHTLKPRLKLGDNEPLEVALSKSPSVRGQVIDADTQEPVALESIEVRHWHNRPVRLLGEGRFELHATRGQTQFTVHANGYPKTRLYFKEGATDQTFTLSKGELVQVHVQDSSGQPLAGASVRVQKKWLQIHMQDIDAVPTDESGNADVRLPPKKYNFGGRAIRVTAELDSYYGPPVETEDFSRGAYSATVVLSPAASLEARIVNVSAEPLGGAQCVLKGLADQSHGGLRPYALAVGRGDACALLSSMLESKKAEERYPCNVFAPGIHAYDPTGFPWVIILSGGPN